MICLNLDNTIEGDENLRSLNLSVTNIDGTLHLGRELITNFKVEKIQHVEYF